MLTLGASNQVESIISEAHNSGKRIRVVGNALSPNGLGLSEDTMLSLGQCDRVLHVDENRETVTVEVRTGSLYMISWVPGWHGDGVVVSR